MVLSVKKSLFGLNKGLIVIGASLFLVSCAPVKWTRADSYRHAALTTLQLIDWQQTLEIADKPDEYYELNPALGKHPSSGAVNLYFASSYALKTLGVVTLPKWRKPLQYMFITLSGACVLNNYSIGLQGKW